MRVRTFATNFLVLAGALLALAVVLEILLQVAMPLVYRPRFTRVDAHLGWYHNAGVATRSSVEGHEFYESYNSHGFRSPEHSYVKPPGSFRIAMLGDSFVDGSEVGDEELFTWRLEQMLPDTEVINLGVYGYSTAQQLIALERVALRYDPDLVVLLTIPNDYWGNAVNFSYFGPAPRFVLDEDSMRFEPTSAPAARGAFRATNLPVPGMSFLHQHSLVYYILNNLIYQRLRADRISRLFEEQTRALSPDAQMELYARLVRRMQAICDQHGVGFLVVFGYERADLMSRESSPNASVSRALAAEGIATVDLFADLRAAELLGDASLYYREDIHWNVSGHQYVADLLRSAVEDWRRVRGATGPAVTRGVSHSND